jgi:SAM-dependent methyltransferase
MSTFEPADYWEKRLSSSFHLGGVGYLGLGELYNRWIYRVRDRTVSRVARVELPADRSSISLLDVGSGTGFYLRMWRRLGIGQVVGSDLTRTSVDALGAQFPGSQVKQFDVGSANVPFASRSFDAISIMDVLPHIVDDEKYLRAIANLADLLRPGGVMFCTEYLCPREHRAQHEVVRTREDVVSAMSKAGFKIEREVPLFVVMNNPICAPSIFSGLWRLMVAPARLHERLGWLLGATLYPVELGLLRLVRRGPSAKLLVLRADENQGSA